MLTAASAPFTTAASRTSAETYFRRILIFFSVLAVTGVLWQFSSSLWAQNELTQPESVVALQSTMLARSGTLYYSLDLYPYTVCAYMPLFYFMDAALIKLGLPAFAAGRMISFTALLGIFVLCWRLLVLYTRDRYCAWTGALICASTELLLCWGVVGQVDTLALFLALSAFYGYSRYSILGERALVSAALLAAAALLTKQTMIACPAAIFLLLWFQCRKAALQFGLVLAAVMLAALAGLEAAMHGRFLKDTVMANLNPWAWEKVTQHGTFLLLASGQLVLILAAGARRAFNGAGKAMLLYLALAALLLAATAPKVGSDSNYQLELTVLLILSASVGLHALGFFRSIFRPSKTWVTLLELPLAVHLVLNYRLTANLIMSRLVLERQFRQQVEALRPYLSDDGRVLSAEMNALVRLRGNVEVEPLICKLLARAGRIDLEPVRSDLEHGTFSTVVLYHDISRAPDPHPEFPTLPERLLAVTRDRYHLAAHIPGPYLGGIYVYRRKGGTAQ